MCRRPKPAPAHVPLPACLLTDVEMCALAHTLCAIQNFYIAVNKVRKPPPVCHPYWARHPAPAPLPPPHAAVSCCRLTQYQRIASALRAPAGAQGRLQPRYRALLHVCARHPEAARRVGLQGLSRWAARQDGTVGHPSESTPASVCSGARSSVHIRSARSAGQRVTPADVGDREGHDGLRRDSRLPNLAARQGHHPAARRRRHAHPARRCDTPLREARAHAIPPCNVPASAPNADSEERGADVHPATGNHSDNEHDRVAVQPDAMRSTEAPHLTGTVNKREPLRRLRSRSEARYR